MSDIPSFEPNWNLDDPNIIGQNADAFVTIEETLARIKLIKEVGLANLYEKGVLVKEPYCSIYDMISAIKNIPVSNGKPRYLPFQQSLVNHSMIKDDIYGKVLSQSFTVFVNSKKIKHSKIQSEDNNNNNLQFRFNSIETFTTSEKEEEFFNFTNNKAGESLIAIIGYQVTDEELANNIIPYEIYSKNNSEIISYDWHPIRIGNIGIRNANSGMTSKIDVYIKQTTTEEEKCWIGGLIDRGCYFDLIAKVNYTNKPIIGDIQSLTEGQNLAIQKKNNEDVLWIEFSDFEGDADRTYISPDSMYNFELNFNGNNIDSKISYNYDGDELLTKTLVSSSSKIRSLVNVILGGAEW